MFLFKYLIFCYNLDQQQPTAQSILSQLTGNLVLSLSEDGRLVLRHDPNIPQDAQSQMILQTILTGALGKFFCLIILLIVSL